MLHFHKETMGRNLTFQEYLGNHKYVLYVFRYMTEPSLATPHTTTDLHQHRQAQIQTVLCNRVDAKMINSKEAHL